MKLLASLLVLSVSSLTICSECVLIYVVIIWSIEYTRMYLAMSLYTGVTDEVCDETNFLPLNTTILSSSDWHLVRFNSQPCDVINHGLSYPFCENSGWGDEEASVVCRSETYSTYGIGGE